MLQRILLSIILLVTGASAFAQNNEIYYLQKIIRQSDGQGGYIYYVTARKNPLFGEPVKFELSGAWLANGEAGLNRLKLYRDLAEKHFVPVSFTEMFVDNRRAASEIQIHPEEVVLSESNRVVYGVTLRADGNNTVVKSADGRRTRTDVSASDDAAVLLDSLLPSNDFDSETFYFSRIVRQSNSDAKGLFVEVRLNPLSKQKIYFPLDPSWEQAGTDVLQPLKDLGTIAETKTVPVSFVTMPTGDGIREIVSIKILAEQVTEKPFFLMASPRGILFFEGPSAKPWRQIKKKEGRPQFNPTDEGLNRLRNELPDHCALDWTPSGAKKTIATEFKKFIRKFWR